MARMQRHNLIDVCQPFALDQLRPDLALYTMQEVARADTLREYLGSAAGLLLLRTTLATMEAAAMESERPSPPTSARALHGNRFGTMLPSISDVAAGVCSPR